MLDPDVKEPLCARERALKDGALLALGMALGSGIGLTKLVSAAELELRGPGLRAQRAVCFGGRGCLFKQGQLMSSGFALYRVGGGNEWKL